MPRRFLSAGLSLSAVLALTTPRAVSSSEYLTAKAAGLANSMVALADDNSAITFNPAGMGQWSRYALAFTFNMTPDREREFVGSIVDTQTQPVGAGVAYVRHYELEESDRPGRDLHRGHLALSFPVYRGLFLGAGAKYFRMQEDRRDELGNRDDLVRQGVGADAGVHWRPFAWWSVGIAGYNLVEVPAVQPEGRREMAGGMLFQAGKYALVTGHVKQVPFENRLTQWSAAAQVTALDMFAFRGGYRREIGEGIRPDQPSVAFGLAWDAPKMTLGYGGQLQLEEPRSLSHSLMLDIHF